MYLVESKEGAIACMVLSLFFLGTFPALLSLLERRGRLPQHTFLDYSITNYLAAVIFALTLGQFGNSSPDRPNFIQQLSQVAFIIFTLEISFASFVWFHSYKIWQIIVILVALIGSLVKTMSMSYWKDDILFE